MIRPLATLRSLPASWVLFVSLAIPLGACGGGGSTKPEPEANHPPVIAQQPDTTANLGSTLVLQAQATDADADTIIYILRVFLRITDFHSGYRPDANMTNDGGVFTFTPSSSDFPVRDFEFIVDDQRGGRDSTRFRVIVR